MIPISTQGRYQLLLALPDEDYQALKADIRKSGVLVPLEYDEHGNVLDGHHRLRAWQELRAEGIRVPDYDRLVRKGLSESEKCNHVRALNLLRRHLTKEQLREQWAAMIDDGATPEQVAENSGVSHMTVRRALDPAFTFVKAHVGKDGKTYPTRYAPRKPATGYARNDKEQQKVTQAAGSNGHAPGKTLLPGEAREARNHAPIDESAETLPVVATTGSQAEPLRCGRFQDILTDLPDASVDLIFTDPPYLKAFVPQWSDLSALAARVLKPTGLLIAYSGQTYLPEVMQRLGEHLQYWWLGAVFHGGSSAMVLADQPVRKIVNMCKPLLFYVRRDFCQDEVIHDAIIGEGSEKGAHAWQQGLAEAEFYIKRLSPERGIVLDPCLGGGTTAIAAIRLGRRFIGSELDPLALSRAEDRLAGERGQA